MNINFTFIRNLFFAFLICIVAACTTDSDSNSGNANNNNSGNGSNNSGTNIKDIEKAVTRSEALDELFNNMNLGTITLTVAQDQWEQLINNTNSKKKSVYVKSDFKYEKNGKTYEMNDIGIRNRGNSSYRAPVDESGNLQQAHFKLKFDTFIDDNAHHMKKALKGINLKFMLNDSSYVQEVYSYDLFKRFGVWTAPRCSYAKLYIKIGDNPESYFGIYKAIEPVSKQFIKARIAAAKFSSDTGNLWKCLYQGGGPADLKNDGNLNGKIGIDSDSYTPVYSLKTNEENLNTEKNQLITFIQNLNSKTGSDFETWIETAFDVDLFLKTLAVSVSCGMWDDYWRNSNNYYLYFDGTGKAFFIPYDYDNSLGAPNDGLMSNPAEQNPLDWGKGNSAPLVTKILAISKYKEKYKEYLKELIDSSKGYFDVASSKARINNWYDLIRSSATGYDASAVFSKDGEDSWYLKEGKPSSKYSLLSSSNNYFDLRAAAIIEATGGALPTYKVIFDANGGNFTGEHAGKTSVTIENVEAKTNPENLVSAEKDNSTFLGWYNNGEKVTKITSDITLTAKWFELTPELLGYSVDTDNNKITFTFDPKMYGVTASDVQTVYIWGEFNKWNTENTDYPLIKDENDVFSGTFELPSNGSEFKYGVNGNQWKGVGDRLDDYAIPEEYGNNNFIIKY